MAADAPSLAQRARHFAAGAHVTAAAWLGETAALALGDGTLRLVRDGGAETVAAHPDGAILTAASDGARLVTGGDDGRLVATRADGVPTLLAERNGAWIDALALHPGGGIAFSTGKTVVARDDKGRERTLTAPSAVRGLAFAPKGYRLAAAHYNGVTLWYPNLDAAPEALAWKGSHLDVTWSPDGRFVVSTMQENALHGWRLQPDKADLRMSGYPAKTRSLSWSHDGLWLATSGAEAAIVWPFAGKEGPMGKPPRECGVRSARVSRVAFHPRALVLAVGYQDGLILLVRLEDLSELLVREAVATGAVTALAWDGTGRRLAFGDAGGGAGTLSLPG